MQMKNNSYFLPAFLLLVSVVWEGGGMDAVATAQPTWPTYFPWRVMCSLLDALFAPLHRCSEKRGTGLGELTRGCASTLWEPDDSSKFLTYKKLFQTSNDWSGAVAWAMIAPRSPLYTARQRLTNLKLGLALKWIVRLKNWVRNGLKLYSVAYA